MDYLIDLIEEAGNIADEHYSGVFSVHRSTTGWEACMGSIHADNTRCYGGKSIESALRAMCAAGKAGKRR